PPAPRPPPDRRPRGRRGGGGRGNPPDLRRTAYQRGRVAITSRRRNPAISSFSSSPFPSFKKEYGDLPAQERSTYLPDFSSIITAWTDPSDKLTRSSQLPFESGFVLSS